VPVGEGAKRVTTGRFTATGAALLVGLLLSGIGGLC
jgi:hypothetical protein